MTLTDKQREVLAQGARGVCIRYVWHWQLGRDSHELCTRTVNALVKRGLMKAVYYNGGQASAGATDEGRAALGVRA